MLGVIEASAPMSVWKFQIYPAQPDRIGPRYSMDQAAKSFEDRVNAALRYPFRFHRINKLCICLGPSIGDRLEYKEMLGVADKHYPNFSYAEYLELSREERTRLLEMITRNVFHWILDNFEDSNFILIAAKNLGWEGFPDPRPREPSQ